MIALLYFAFFGWLLPGGLVAFIAGAWPTAAREEAWRRSIQGPWKKPLPDPRRQTNSTGPCGAPPPTRIPGGGQEYLG